MDKARWGTVYPKEVPYLRRIQPKDPISLENLGHVKTPNICSILVDKTLAQSILERIAHLIDRVS